MTSADHLPWTLDGAQQRIEAVRQGDCQLRLVLPDGQIVPEESVYSLSQTRHAFNFGGSLAADWEVPNRDWYPEFKDRFANLFNYATIDFYWAVHSNQQGNWNYRADSREKLEWAKQQGMRLRGHPLMWHEVVPEWIASPKRPVEDLDQDIMAHVRMLVEDFPEIDEWDLYNETPGIRLKAPDMGARRWVESQGGPGPATEVIVDAVRGIQPDGRFIVNHFAENDPEYHKQIEYCLSNEVSFDAIGIQTHMHHQGDAFSEERLWNALERYSKYGKPLQLSEISILSCEIFPDWETQCVWEEEIAAASKAGKPAPCKPSTPEWERYQADLARDFYTLAFSHPAVESIIWWTITDLKPWRGMPAGLLDAKGQPKPAYHALDQLINHEWNTQMQGNTGANGAAQFRGFYGSYAITVEHRGKTFVGQFDLQRDQREVQTVALRSVRKRMSLR
ncbi:MAG: endo-1,4-beta-xylanase [Verrucomicrobia bacterium]|nr:endo-1,4-beta-xylanase [Verrucomicrobiota bacterium]MBL6837512.1 endo-1,4-beta-xylanase [Puniceicoccaceae bacterium]MBL6912661.1 endo-1,4-beta-xylanase [Puniceicoccaceae bacterium]